MLPVNNFEWIKDSSQFNENFIENYTEDEGHFLEINVQYLEELHELHSDLPFLPDRMKIEKVEKLVGNLYDNSGYVIHIRNSKQALNHGLVLKKVHKIIKLNKNVWPKPYIDMNADLRKKKQKLILKKIFLSWWIMQFSGKLWKMWESIDVLNLSQYKEEGIIWVSEPNYHTTKFFRENLLAIELKKQRYL